MAPGPGLSAGLVCVLHPGRLPRFHQSGPPRSWVPSNVQTRTPHRQVQERVEHEGGLAGQCTDNQRHGDGQGPQQHSIGRSLRPRTAAPPTVLVADMGYISESGRRHTAAAGVASAFGSTDPAPSSGQGEAL
jgi:hypothetical protein